MSDVLLITLISKTKKVLLLTELLRLNKYELIYAFFTLIAFKPLRPS
jgi:hypothetical protein